MPTSDDYDIEKQKRVASVAPSAQRPQAAYDLAYERWLQAKPNERKAALAQRYAALPLNLVPTSESSLKRLTVFLRKEGLGRVSSNSETGITTGVGSAKPVRDKRAS